MKDIVITAKSLKREALVFLACLVGSEFVNLGAIISYHRPFIELLSQIGFVVVLALIAYVVLAIIRFIIRLIIKIFNS